MAFPPAGIHATGAVLAIALFATASHAQDMAPMTQPATPPAVATVPPADCPLGQVRDPAMKMCMAPPARCKPAVMVRINQFLAYSATSGPRGQQRVTGPGAWMLMIDKDLLPRNRFSVSVMGSLEQYTVGSIGTPQLLQTENLDAMHAHDTLMAVEFRDTIKLGAANEAKQASSDEVDPVAEAEIFLAYGRDAQAEELLKEALQTSPGRHEIHLKLLQIYVNRKDASAFEKVARDLQQATGGKGNIWDQASVLGYQIDPGNSRYAAGKSAAGATTSTLATSSASAENVDFNVGTGQEESMAPTRGSSTTRCCLESPCFEALSAQFPVSPEGEMRLSLFRETHLLKSDSL